jgi:hypothetical protein
MWPIDRFAEVGRELFSRYGMLALIIGGPADQALCEGLREDIGFGAHSVAGKTSTLQMLDLISAATIFVGNDSGPAHISGALGVETFTISPFPLSSTVDHVNSPRRFRPLGPRVHVFQPIYPFPPCSLACVMNEAHCILQVSAREVLDRIARTSFEFSRGSVETTTVSPIRRYVW